MAILNDDGTITVESGDTFNGIVNLLAQNGIEISVEDLMALNADSMSNPGDATTLQVGALLATAATDDATGDAAPADPDEPAPEPPPSRPFDPDYGSLQPPEPEAPEVRPDPTRTVNDVVIPSDTRLVKLKSPDGSDDRVMFYLVGDLNGVQVGYEIGNRQDLIAIFGGVDAFDNVKTYQNQGQFDDDGIVVVGTVDEVMGATETLQAQFDRDLRALGFESLPQWMRDDPQLMAMMVVADREGWSQGRIWNEIAGFDSFQARFNGFDTLADQLGTNDVGTIVNEYLGRENMLRTALQTFRGPNTNVSPEYLSGLVASGWSPAEARELLELERDVTNNQAALLNINEILALNGQPTLSPDDFVDFLREGRQLDADDTLTPSELFNSINDALRLTSLQQAGLDVSSELATELGAEGDFGAIGSPSGFRDEAQYVAGVVAANFNELNAGKFGLTQDAVIKAFMGQGDENTKRQLEQFARERGIAARGFERSTAFMDSSGRLRIQGFGDL